MFKKIATLSFVSAILTSCGVFGSYESTEYDVVKKNDSIEIRQYKPYIIAKVEVEGDRENSLSAGFRNLAGYIFGDNIADQEISMTTPVIQQATSQEIAMTTPVTQNKLSDDKWIVTFKMPEKYTLETLPTPKNDKVKFEKISAHKSAVIVFSGFYSDENFMEKEMELISYLQSNNIKHTNTATYAYYNPPWTLWFMRRNEVIIKLD